MSCPHGNPIGGCDTCDEVDAAFEAGKRSALAEQPAPMIRGDIRDGLVDDEPAQQQPAPANLWLYWKVDDKSVVTGPFKTHSKDEAYGLDCIDQTPLTVAAPQPAQQQALDAQIHKAGMNPVMQGECYLMHPEALQKLIEVAIREALAEQPAQQEPVAWLVCENWRKHSLFFTEEGAEDFKNAAQREDDLSGNLARWKAKPLYTSPPAQRKPLTRDQVKAMMVENGYDQASPQERADFINGLRHGEVAHGITKGGAA